MGDTTGPWFKGLSTTPISTFFFGKSITVDSTSSLHETRLYILRNQGMKNTALNLKHISREVRTLYSLMSCMLRKNYPRLEDKSVVLELEYSKIKHTSKLWNSTMRINNGYFIHTIYNKKNCTWIKWPLYGSWKFCIRQSNNVVINSKISSELSHPMIDMSKQFTVLSKWQHSYEILVDELLGFS
jgi:hypothetical protein